nr:uncharacterized mitochondrial protein AtMg00810-like [Tanacetum cinerariifolium]
KRIFRYLKGKPNLELWYPTDSPFDLVAYSDSDYAGVSLDRKSITGGCQFLGCRLISWQCKKQTVVAISSTEAEYVAAASCCAQVKQKKYGIFISQDKYVAKILRKFGLTKGKSTSTPIDTEKPLLKDPDVVAISSTEAEYVAAASCCAQFKNTVTIKQDNDVTRMQALVDKKKVVVTVAAIRDVLRLDDAEGVDCLPNEEIFAELASMGHEKPSTKLTFYKAFFSSQWKFLIQTILQSMSAKRTSWNEFSSAMASAVICLSTGQEIEEGGDEEEHVKDVTAAQGDDAQEPSIPSPTPPTQPPQPPQDLPSTSQLKRRVKKLEKGNMVKVLKLRRLKRIGTSQRIDTSDDTVMDDESNQGRIIDEMDTDDDVALMDDKEEDKKHEEAKVVENDQPAEVHEVVDVVTTAKLITEVVTAASETVTTAIGAAPSRRRKGVVIRDLEEESTTSSIIPADTKSKDKGKWIMVEEPKPLKKKEQIKMDEEYAKKLHAELNKDIDWDIAIDHVKLKAKEDPAMEEEESKALQSINETPAQKAAKRRKLNEEVEDLKRHLEIVPDEDDDVYTKATPLARKLSDIAKEFVREDLEALRNLVKEMFSTSKPRNFSDNFLLTTLRAMFKKPGAQAQVWKNQRTIHGQAKVKSWKLLESCVRLRVEEESEMSLEILRFTRQQHQEGQLE